MKTILVIDDLANMITAVAKALQGKVIVGTEAWSSYGDRVCVLGGRYEDEAREAFQKNQADIALILMDYELEAYCGATTGADLTKEFRAAGFTGPILANSSSSHSNKLLMEAGCSHFGSYGKWMTLIPELLEL